MRTVEHTEFNRLDRRGLIVRGADMAPKVRARIERQWPDWNGGVAVKSPAVSGRVNLVPLKVLPPNTYRARLADTPRRLTPTKMGNARFSFKFDDARFPRRVRTRENSGGILAHSWDRCIAGDVVEFALTEAGTIWKATLVERA